MRTIKSYIIHKLTLSGVFYLILNVGMAQTQKIKGRISSDTADISILGIYPDSFPDVSVIFRAETRQGLPLWNLPIEKISVLENERACEIVSLCPVSGKKPLNIALVIDHSGSMAADPYLFINPDGSLKQNIELDENGFPIIPSGFETPLQKAKKAVSSFVGSLKRSDELVSIIGFSSTVDKILPLTSDRRKIQAMVEGMEPDFSTACYDGIKEGLKQLKKGDGIKVLVVLTDGQDNSSSVNWQEVARIARNEKIPVYTIGLGMVNGEVLQSLAQGTGGRYFITRNSGSLDTIYKTISQQVQAYYELVYRSENLNASDSNRTITLAFDSDSLVVLEGKASEKFPAEMIRLVAEKKKVREYAIAGGSVLAAVIGVSLLFTYRNRRKKTPQVFKIIPNPNPGKFELDFEMPENGELLVMSNTGQKISSKQVAVGMRDFDFSELPDGDYRIILQSAQGKSNATILRIRH